MKQEALHLIQLASAVVNRTTCEIEDIHDVDLEALHHLSASHNLTALVDAALKTLGMDEGPFCGTLAISARRELLFDSERKIILARLEQAGIWYLPLKGIFLKEDYPGVGIREMSDNDILFDASRAEDVRSIMDALDFTCVSYDDDNVDDYQKPPVFHFEMHRSLFSGKAASFSRLSEYYKDVEQKLIPFSQWERRFSDEDFYIYTIAHEYSHFSTCGTGLRSLLDTYVYLLKHDGNLDWHYIDSETRKLGIRDFEEQNRHLALEVFSPRANLASLSLEDEEFLDCFLRAGTYGSRENMVQIGVKKSGNLFYVLGRLFPPMSVIQASFPVFCKHKILLPFLPFYRLMHNGGWRKARKEIKVLASGAGRGDQEQHESPDGPHTTCL